MFSLKDRLKQFLRLTPHWVRDILIYFLNTETASQSSLALRHDPSLLAAIGAGGPQGEQQN